MSDDLVARIDALYDKATKGPWLLGGPYPGVSVCVETDAGSTHPDYMQPPTWEPVCVLDQRSIGEQNPQAKADAELICALVNAWPEIKAALRNEDAERWNGIQFVHPMDLATVIMGARTNEGLMKELARRVDAARKAK